MPRNPKNKSKRPGATTTIQGPKTQGIKGKTAIGSRPELVGDALERYNELKEELRYYQKERNSVWSRRSKIKQILDNFERVIAEDIVADASGYSLNEREIDNIIDDSIILSKSEIELYLNELNTTSTFRTQLKMVNSTIFLNPQIKQIAQNIDELGTNEAYSKLIITLAGGTGLPGVQGAIIDGYITIIEQLESQLL